METLIKKLKLATPTYVSSSYPNPGQLKELCASLPANVPEYQHSPSFTPNYNLSLSRSPHSTLLW